MHHWHGTQHSFAKAEGIPKIEKQNFCQLYYKIWILAYFFYLQLDQPSEADQIRLLSYQTIKQVLVNVLGINFSGFLLPSLAKLDLVWRLLPSFSTTPESVSFSDKPILNVWLKFPSFWGPKYKLNKGICTGGRSYKLWFGWWRKDNKRLLLPVSEIYFP